MRTVGDVVRDLTEAKERNDHSRCIALCSEGIALTGDPSTPDWYVFRINLCRFLLDYDGETTNRRSPEDVEKAIHIYSEILSTLPKVIHGPRRGSAAMGLGWAYYLREAGSPSDNMEKAVTAFAMALRHYKREDDPSTWASLKAAIGMVYSKLQTNNAINYLSKSIRSYEEALQVFTEAEYPEDRKEIIGKLHELRNRQREKK